MRRSVMDSIERIAVVGAGNMGSGIAQKSAQEGFIVQMIDREKEFVDRGIMTIEGFLDEAVERRILSDSDSKSTLSRVSGAVGVESIDEKTDLVIEAVFEDLEVKRSVLQGLSSSCSEKTIIATNTSSLSVEQLSLMSDRPDRFIGLHFFYHPAKNRLVEVIPSSSTSDSSTKAVVQYCRAMGKVVIICKDRPGFVVNRFFVPWLNEACILYEDGIGTPAQIDAIARESFGIGMGPFALMNLTGPSIALHSTDYLATQLDTDRFTGADCLRKLVEEGREWDLSGTEVCEQESSEVIRSRLFGTVFCVSSQIVQEDICSMEDVDRGAKVGLRWAKGPFEMANSMGVDLASKLASEYASLASMETPSLMIEQGSEPFKFDFFDLNLDGEIATITFNRPEAMNALNVEVMAQLGQIWESIESNDSIKTAVFRGAGKAFVAGADIKFFVDRIESNQIQKIQEFTEEGHRILNNIQSSRLTTIALISGLALGGGLELALCCDHRIGVPKTMLRFPETGIGIYPGLGGTQRAVQIAGAECARYAIIAGNWMDSEDALSMGYLTEVVAFSDIEKAVINASDGTTEPYGYPYSPRLGESEKIGNILSSYTREGMESMISGSFDMSNHFLSRQAKLISRNAPIAIQMATDLIEIADGSREDRGIGLQAELDGLDAIFSTNDALKGLKSVLEGSRVSFDGA